MFICIQDIYIIIGSVPIDPTYFTTFILLDCIMFLTKKSVYKYFSSNLFRFPPDDEGMQLTHVVRRNNM
jgi:hypothetical protein